MEKSKYQTGEVQEDLQKQQKLPYRLTRRERRRGFKEVYNNNRKPKGTGFLNMGIAWNTAAIYMPKRKKLKGYQKTK